MPASGTSPPTVVRTASPGGFALLAAWPEAGVETRQLRENADIAVAEQRPVAQGASSAAGSPGACVAFPVLLDDSVVAAVAIEIRIANPAQARDELRAAIRQLQWGAAWLRDHLRSRRA